MLCMRWREVSDLPRQPTPQDAEVVAAVLYKLSSQKRYYMHDHDNISVISDYNYICMIYREI
jgi:hypothetical protein